jgi:hypothetical protein
MNLKFNPVVEEKIMLLQNIQWNCKLYIANDGG